MQDDVRDQRLLERRREALDELRRQPPDESDGVRHEVPLAEVLEAARRRVERLEEAILDGHLGAGEGVEQRRLADVRVSGERDRRRRGAGARLAPRRAMGAHLAQAPAQERDPPIGETTVGLELRLAGAARADAPAEALEVLPHAPHARQVVLELSELDLELSLGRDGVLREDVEDQLRPVDDAGRQRVLERALLRRLELVVDDQHLGSCVAVRRLELLELALADVAPRIGPDAMLDDLSDGRHAGRPGELPQLRELLVAVHAFREHGEHEPPFGLGTGRPLELCLGHGRKYAPASCTVRSAR